MLTNEQTVRVLRDAQAIIASKLLEDSEKYELLTEMANALPPEFMALKIHKVTRNAIERARKPFRPDFDAKEAREREAKRREEQTEVVAQGAQEDQAATTGPTSGVEESNSAPRPTEDARSVDSFPINLPARSGNRKTNRRP